MSIIFGIRKPMGASVSEGELLHLAEATEYYAPDGVAVHAAGRIGMGFQPYHTHLRSEMEHGPISDVYGNVLVIDGRIDNYRDLCRELQLNETATPDSQLVLAAFLHWGEGCFSRFIGDWALTFWSAKEQVLYLARDHAGARTLYFENKGGTLLWSTHLESFFADPRSVEVDESYAASYLCAQPVRDLTPYKGIRAVLPAHYVIAGNDTLSKSAHWQWMSESKIRYNSNEEYDEHFLALFRQAVERRTVPGAPILAQLSGGMDSTSIVCMSDQILRTNNQSAELLDTISFYDDSEPSWDEKPYFSAVEKKRGKTGIHIQMSPTEWSFEPHDPALGIYLLPGADSSTIERERKIQVETGGRGYRSILSGIGGDEILGGVPTSKPELADCLVSGNLNLLLKRTSEWCVTERSPLLHTLFDTAKYTASLYRQGRTDEKPEPPWVQQHLQRISADHRSKDVTTAKRSHLLPSSISNGLAWWSILETLPHNDPGLLERPEYRYPYLDKQLVDYLFSIPREQHVQPGRRRSLMRRALKNIVPEEVIERKRKAYQIRGPLAVMQQSRNKIDRLLSGAAIIEKGFIDPVRLQAALDLTVQGRDIRWWQAIMRVITFEMWLTTNSQSRGMERRRPHRHQFLLPSTGATKIRTISVAG